MSIAVLNSRVFSVILEFPSDQQTVSHDFVVDTPLYFAAGLQKGA